MPNKIIDLYNHTLMHKGFDYSQITENVFMGTNMCCQFGFDRELLSKGVRADISLQKEKVDAPIGVDYFLWLPTVDKEAPNKDQLELGVNSIEFLIKRKVKIYIHCMNGHGRAPALFIAYLIRKGMKIDDAIKLVKEKRPSIHLSASQRKALQNFR